MRSAWLAALFALACAAVFYFSGCAILGLGETPSAGETLLDSTGTVEGYVYVPRVSLRQTDSQEIIVLDEPTTSAALDPLPGARVILEGGEQSVQTDANGRFAFDNVPLGDDRGIDVGIMPPSDRSDLQPVTERMAVRQRLRNRTRPLPIPADIARTGLVVLPRFRAVPTGKLVQFRALVVRAGTSDGQTRPRAFLVPKQYVTWALAEGSVGSIDSSTGIFSAGSEPGLATVSATATIPPDPEMGRTEQIVLTGEARVRVIARPKLAVAAGTVTGSGGEPFVGAIVMAAVPTQHGPRPIHRFAVVGQDGRYRLGGLPSNVQVLLLCIYGTEEGQFEAQQVTLAPGLNEVNFDIPADVAPVQLDPIRGRLRRFPGHPESYQM